MIVDYDTLKERIASWLARADLNDAIPDFIQLAEANLSRELKAREMQGEVAGDSVNGVIDLPSDLVGVRGLRAMRGGFWATLSPVPPDFQSGRQGFPVGYSVINGQARLIGSEDVAYVLTYSKAIPALSDSNPQNWLLSKEPGLYLYGALVEAAPYIANDERTTVWATQYRRILDGVNAHYDMESYGNATSMRVGFNAP